MLNNRSDSVVLSINTYNKFKNAAVKADLVIDRMFDLAKLSGDTLTFDPAALSDLLKLAYPERYANRFSALVEEKKENLLY